MTDSPQARQAAFGRAYQDTPQQARFAALRAKRAARERLEYLRGELRGERISYGELAELQNLVPYIEAGDVELLAAAGVPEFPEEES